MVSSQRYLRRPCCFAIVFIQKPYARALVKSGLGTGEYLWQIGGWLQSGLEALGRTIETRYLRSTRPRWDQLLVRTQEIFFTERTHDHSHVGLDCCFDIARIRRRNRAGPNNFVFCEVIQCGLRRILIITVDAWRAIKTVPAGADVGA